MGTTKRTETRFAIAVYGYAPEFWPPTAFRRQKRLDGRVKLKEISCPYCGKLFMSVCVSRRLELYRYTKEIEFSCHEYKKCKLCFERIGVIYCAV